MAGTAAGLRFLKRAKHYHKELGVSGFFHRGQTLKKHTYLTRVFACVIVSSPTFCWFGSRSEAIYWRGDLALGNVLLVGRISVSITLFLFFQQVSTCREGKLGGFFALFLSPIWGWSQGVAFFWSSPFLTFFSRWGPLGFCRVP